MYLTVLLAMIFLLLMHLTTVATAEMALVAEVAVLLVSYLVLPSAVAGEALVALVMASEVVLEW